MAKGTNSIIGMSGEFAVASELLRRGFQANVTFGNAKAMDIIITSNNSSLKNRYMAKQLCCAAKEFIGNLSN